MSAQSLSHNTEIHHLSRQTIFTLATGTGLSVATIYYNQPLLGLMAQDLQANVSSTGFVPTFTQIGYALGILLLVPLGDKFNRRYIILLKSLLLSLALLLCSLMPALEGLLLASLAIGILATMAQDIVPATAALAPAEHRGRTVGAVMTGLLTGILLSRVFSGMVGEYYGWRMMYQLAALSILLIGFRLWWLLPDFAADTKLSYPALLTSMAGLWKKYSALRRAAWSQGLLSVAFSAFWSTLAVMLHTDFQLGSAVAGAFGLAGAAGALAAPLAGAIADKQGPERVTQLGAALVALSFAAMFLLPLLPVNGQILLLVVSAIGFDLGVQAALIANQTLVYGLEPEARGRLNALLFTSVFIGMATGSALGSIALADFGWTGVISLATVAAIASLLVRLKAKSA
ncbi:MFS transporter [Rheinheimera sp.]|uniref:MFS transporter n=1 Tax=Rheinheimera sp. TaxID=1869214 RepID=UPI002637C500|nr:MFS transporter [Rheinheimera sp.]MCA1929944.1 MFS transporter [Rheinheimera sp.]